MINDSLSKAPKNLAELLAFVDAYPGLGARLEREMTSAIRSTAKWFAQPLDQIPTSASVIRRRFKSLHPGHVGIGRGRLANTQSLIRKAFILSGVSQDNRPVRSAVSTAWTRILDEITGRYLRTALGPFARYCSRHDIEPNEVTNSVANDYREYLETVSLNKSPQALHQTLCRIWIRARYVSPSWPRTELSVPTYKVTYTLPWEAFPQSLRDEVDQYFHRLSAKTPDGELNIDALLDEHGPARALRPASIKTKRYQTRQYLSALVIEGMPIDTMTSLANLVRPDHFRTALGFLLKRPRKDNANVRSAGQVAHTIRSIAKYWAQLPKNELDRLHNVTVKLNSHSPGMTAKNRHRLAQFENPSDLRRFLRYPLEELNRVLNRREISRGDAVKASHCIALLILMAAPMRIANLAGLRFDEHVVLPTGGKRGTTSIAIPRGQVKNDQPLNYFLSEEDTKYVVAYRKRILPLLDPSTTPYLFPNGRGGQKRADTMSKQLSLLVWDHLGIRFNAHLARHLSVKIGIDANPGNYEGQRRLLGHKSHETTYATYEGLETNSAARLHDSIIRERRGYVPFGERPRARKRLSSPKSGTSIAPAISTPET